MFEFNVLRAVLANPLSIDRSHIFSVEMTTSALIGVGVYALAIDVHPIIG